MQSAICSGRGIGRTFHQLICQLSKAEKLRITVGRRWLVYRIYRGFPAAATRFAVIKRLKRRRMTTHKKRNEDKWPGENTEI